MRVVLMCDSSMGATFRGVGLCPELCGVCEARGWAAPTAVQAAAIRPALAGRDVVAVARTGSGKTAAFALPLLERLLAAPRAPRPAGLVLVPTRELAAQVAAEFAALGAGIGLGVATLLGGVDMVAQACELARRPHVIVGTPGRVKDHLVNTKGFRLTQLQTLVIDEADKMLDMDYEKEIDAILEYLPRQRQTLLFSATLSTKVDRLQNASLKEPILLQVHRKNTTVETLSQKYIFCPHSQMIAYLHVFLSQEEGKHIMIFCSSGYLVQKLCVILRILGHKALPMMGKMIQENRRRVLEKFKENEIRCLVCTDVAQRGLDISHVDVVINYSLPMAVKDYIHRVGRTARAGSHGRAVNIISQYDIPQLQNIESNIQVRMSEIEISETDINSCLQRD